MIARQDHLRRLQLPIKSDGSVLVEQSDNSHRFHAGCLDPANAFFLFIDVHISDAIVFKEAPERLKQCELSTKDDGWVLVFFEKETRETNRTVSVDAATPEVARMCKLLRGDASGLGDHAVLSQLPDHSFGVESERNGASLLGVALADETTFADSISNLVGRSDEASEFFHVPSIFFTEFEREGGSAVLAIGDRAVGKQEAVPVKRLRSEGVEGCVVDITERFSSAFGHAQTLAESDGAVNANNIKNSIIVQACTFDMSTFQEAA